MSGGHFKLIVGTFKTQIQVVEATTSAIDRLAIIGILC